MDKKLGSAVEIVKVANGYIVWGPYDFQTNGRRDMSVTMVFETFERASDFLRTHLASVPPDTQASP